MHYIKVIKIKKVIYIGHMEEGKVKVGERYIVGKHGIPVEVSDKEFDYLVKMPDWKGIWKEEEKKVKIR